MTKDSKVHVDYVIYKPDDQNERTMPLLEVIDPMAFVAALWNFNDEDVHALVGELNKTFQYSDGEIIPLQIIDSPYDFLLFKKSIENTRPLGCVWSDADGGRDGHELEVLVKIEEFCKHLNKKRGIDPINDNIETDGYCTTSMTYGNRCIPDSNGYYLIMLPEDNEFASENEDENGNWYIEISLTEDNIDIGIHVIKEKCIEHNEDTPKV